MASSINFIITNTPKLKRTFGLPHGGSSGSLYSSKFFELNNCFNNFLSGVCKNVIQKVQIAVIKPTLKHNFHLFEIKGALILVLR